MATLRQVVEPPIVGGSTIQQTGVSTTPAPLVQNMDPVGSVFSPDYSLGGIMRLVLNSATCTIQNPISLTVGARISFLLVQGTGGNKAVTTWGGLYKFMNNTPPVLSIAEGDVDLIEFVYDGLYLYQATALVPKMPSVIGLATYTLPFYLGSFAFGTTEKLPFTLGSFKLV